MDRKDKDLARENFITFSLIKIVKNCLRSTMEQDCLNSLILLNGEIVSLSKISNLCSPPKTVLPRRHCDQRDLHALSQTAGSAEKRDHYPHIHCQKCKLGLGTQSYAKIYAHLMRLHSNEAWLNRPK